MRDEAPSDQVLADPALDRVDAIVRAVSDLLTKRPQLVCLDFVDVKVTLEPERGRPSRAFFGQGEASGPGRALRAAEAALADLRRDLAEARSARRDDGGP